MRTSTSGQSADGSSVPNGQSAAPPVARAATTPVSAPSATRGSSVAGTTGAPERAEQVGVEMVASAEERPGTQAQAELAAPGSQGAPASLAALLALCARYLSPADLDLIRTAFATAAEAHAGVCRKSGEPYIEHPLAVARILAELAVDAQGIAAALLHDTVEDTGMTVETLRARFGPTIAAVVDGVTKFSAVETPDAAYATLDGALGGTGANGAAPADGATPGERKARLHAQTVHKLFLAMLRDPRVVLLKLADRLHNMRTMGVMSARQREVKSREVLDIYAPLAGRIGLYVFKNELEDLAFAHLYPTEYERIARLLKVETERRLPWAEHMCERMRHELAESGITAAVNYRFKRAYRAWIEAEESGIRVGALNDLITFRVLVTTVGDCYRALGEIHRIWLPYERIRDYIAHAKTNGYQSLHTAVFALEGHLAPIHIRTHRMHRAAQHGVTTYWLERVAAATEPGGPGESLLHQMPAWVSQLSSWENDLKLSPADFLDAIRDEMLEENQVFVFTPRGDVYELPAGATVLDLAYRIHTRIGDQATGAQIQTTNRDDLLVVREVPIDHVLHTNDVVQVLTDARSHPQPEWRHLAVTRYAREKIARSLRLLSRAEQAGDASIDLRQLPLAPDEPAAETEPEQLPQPLRHPSGKPAQVRLAYCCYPCPSDEIAGVAGEGRMVTIHRVCCRTLARILAQRAARGAAYASMMTVSWDEIEPVAYRLHLAIYGQDHRGLMHEVSACVAALGLNVVYTVARANQDRSKAAILLTLDMPPGVRRDMVLRRLRTVPGVTEVERDTRRGCDEAQ